MKPARLAPCRLVATAASLALLWPTNGLAESRFAPPGGGASASLDFRIIIPPVMRVLENNHPPRLDALADGSLGGSQRLVVLSNMRRGFCVTLRSSLPSPNGWELQAQPEPGVRVEPAGDAWRVCSARPGRYTLVLQHRFGRGAEGRTPSLVWPVQTDITTL